MEKLVHDKASIHYTISGNKLPTLLFVHGASINLTYWDAQVEYFHNRYTVIAIDLPEHGKSGRNQTHWSIEAMGKSVADFIKDLALEQVIMVGHSMGGNVNLVAATTYSDPILGFIGVDNFKNAGQPLAEEYQQQSKEIIQNLHHNFSDTNESYARMVLLTPQTPEAVTDRVVRDYRQAYQPMTIETIEAVFTNQYKTERELLPKLPCKLHLINVDYMPTAEEPLRQYATSGYEVHHMAGTSHFPMIENPDELNRKLEEVLAEISQKK